MPKPSPNPTNIWACARTKPSRLDQSASHAGVGDLFVEKPIKKLMQSDALKGAKRADCRVAQLIAHFIERHVLFVLWFHFDPPPLKKWLNSGAVSRTTG